LLELLEHVYGGYAAIARFRAKGADGVAPAVARRDPGLEFGQRMQRLLIVTIQWGGWRSGRRNIDRRRHKRSEGSHRSPCTRRDARGAGRGKFDLIAVCDVLLNSNPKQLLLLGFELLLRDHSLVSQ
jgi:hypothetical protein